MTPADVMREQCGGSGREHHNERRSLTWAELMSEPLDWDAWCLRRYAAEVAEQARRGRQDGAP